MTLTGVQTHCSPFMTQLSQFSCSNGSMMVQVCVDSVGWGFVAFSKYLDLLHMPVKLLVAGVVVALLMVSVLLSVVLLVMTSTGQGGNDSVLFSTAVL